MQVDEGFEAYVRERWTPLVRTAVFLGCSTSDAEDLAQTVLVQALRSWSRVEKADNRDAYVYRMLVNAFRRSRERRWWGERPTDDLPDSEVPDATSGVDLRDELTGLLSRLPAEQRQVLVLRFVADLSEAQTAAALGIAAGTVKSRTSRALAACERMREDAHE